MLPSPYRDHHEHTPLTRRRHESKRARVSAHTSGPGGDQSTVYPSPPMSGSSPPSYRDASSNDRGYGRGSHGSMGQDLYRGGQAPQHEVAYPSRVDPVRPFQAEPPGPSTYPFYEMGRPSTAFAYHQAPASLSHHPHPHQSSRHMGGGQVQPSPYSSMSHEGTEPMGGESSAFSPKTRRKIKEHVVSACVPCKRAHLRCDARRPCSRCISNGKEDNCHDVQHKKRGRPRIRDERAEALGYGGPITSYGSPLDLATGLPSRPISMLTSSVVASSTPLDSLQRANSHRVLKSTSELLAGPRHPNYALSTDANVYGGAIPLAPRLQAYQEPPCAYLTAGMQIAKATHKFSELLCIQSVVARKFIDIVSLADRDKVMRLERIFEGERRAKEASYLPPIYLKYEEDRVIQSIGFGPNELSQFLLNQHEILHFPGMDGQQRLYHARFGLAKKDSTHFIVVLLDVSTTPQQYSQPWAAPLSTGPYPGEPQARESQYGFQNPRRPYSQPSLMSPFLPSSPYGDPRIDHRSEPTGYRSSVSSAPTMSPSGIIPISNQLQPRWEQPQPQFRTPLPEPRRDQPRQQRDVQLPPIRDSRYDAEERDIIRGRRNSRVDIGGLFEKPGFMKRG